MMIREISRIVHKNVSREMLAMRYGGDEFVLFGGYKEGEEYKVDQILESIRADFKDVNESSKYPFSLSASMGVSKWKACNIRSLDSVIEEADKRMYEEKRERKRRAVR